jgi:hypothetical protein
MNRMRRSNSKVNLHLACRSSIIRRQSTVVLSQAADRFSRRVPQPVLSLPSSCASHPIQLSEESRVVVAMDRGGSGRRWQKPGEPWCIRSSAYQPNNDRR